MGQVVVVLWRPGATPVHAITLEHAADAAAWSTAYRAQGVWIGVQGPRVPSVQVLDAGRSLVIGERFSNILSTAQDAANDSLARARSLVRTSWGRYIALFGSPETGFMSVLRDPSGALDCAVWTDGPCTIVASCLPRWLTASATVSLSPDLGRVADMLADPTLMSGPIALHGVAAVAPGQWRAFDGRTVSLWRPADQARAARDTGAAGATTLRSAVDDAVRNLGGEAALVEVSGGLDSAIVATARHAIHTRRQTIWANVWGPFIEADERAYARAVCDRLGVNLRLVERIRPARAEGLCLSHPRALRPSINRMDAAFDHGQASLVRDLGLEMILTGKGGDVAFYQTATSAILADRLQDRGLSALADPCIPVLARRMRRSAWRVLWRALTAASRVRKFGGAGRPPLGLAHRDIARRRPAPHPWLQDLGGVPPGKRQQIVGFASNLSLHGLSQRTEAADLVHPLLSQPVMEACLRTPSWTLTGGGHDRLLAREAFADRLPHEILERRSKGELAAYYGHVLADASEALHAHLLDGRLAAAGLIDRVQVEAALKPDHLIWQGGYGDLMMLALIESWLRAWD